MNKCRLIRRESELTPLTFPRLAGQGEMADGLKQAGGGALGALAGWTAAVCVDGSSRGEPGRAGAGGQVCSQGSGWWGGKAASALPSQRSRPSTRSLGRNPRAGRSGRCFRPRSTGTSSHSEPSGLDRCRCDHLQLWRSGQGGQAISQGLRHRQHPSRLNRVERGEGAIVRGERVLLERRCGGCGARLRQGSRLSPGTGSQPQG